MDKCFMAHDLSTNRHSCAHRFNAKTIFFQTKFRKFTEIFKVISVAIKITVG